MSTPIRIQVVLDGSQAQGQLGQIISGAFGGAGGRMSDMDQIFQRTWQNFGEMGAKVISGLQKQMAQMLESHVNNFPSAMNRISSTSRGAAQGQFGPTNADRGALLRQSAFQYANRLDLMDYNQRLAEQQRGDLIRQHAMAYAGRLDQQDYDRQIANQQRGDSLRQRAFAYANQLAKDEYDRQQLPQLGPTNSDRGNLLRQRAFAYANQFSQQDYDRQQAIDQLPQLGPTRQDRTQLISQMRGQEQYARDQADHQEKMKEIFDRINQSGGRISSEALEAPVKFFESIGNQMIRLSAIIYSFGRVGNLIGDVTVRPVEDVINATALSRRFQGSIAGTVGGMGNASAIDNSLIAGLPGSPYTLEEARQSAQISSRISALSPAFGLASPQGAAAQVQEIADIIARLQVGSPDKTGEEIGKAVQSYLEGNTRSLRQIGIDPRDLQAISGLAQKDLSENQQASLDALRTRSRQLVPDSVMNVRMTDPEFLVQRIHDLFTVAMQRVGDSGLYDEVGKKLQSGFDQMFSYVQSSDFQSRAAQIGRDLESIVGSVIDAGATFLQYLSGSSTKAGNLPDATGQVQTVVHSVANTAHGLRHLAAGAGYLLHEADNGAEDISTLFDTNLDTSNPNVLPNINDLPGGRLRRFMLGQFVPLQNSSEHLEGISGQVLSGATRNPVDYFRTLLSQNYPTGDIDSLVKRGDDPFASMFTGVNRSMDLLGAGGDKTDKLGKVLEDGANALNAVFTKFKLDPKDAKESPGDFFTKIREYQSSEINKLEDARGGLLDLAKHYKGTDRGDMAQGYLDKIDVLESELSQLETSIKGALDRLGEGAGKFNVSYIDALKGEDPSVRDAEISRVLAGNTDVGRRVAMARAGVTDPSQLTSAMMRQYGGMGAVPSQYQPAMLQDQISAHMDFLTQQGKYNKTPGANTLLFGQGVAGQQASYLQSMMPDMQKQLVDAQKNLAANPSDENRTSVERLTADISRLRSEMDQLSMSSSAAMQSFLEFGKQATDSIENGLGNALYGIISGTEKASQAFRAMAQEILKSFTQMGVHAAFNSVGLNGSGNAGGAIGAIIKMFQGFGGGDKMGNSPNPGGGPSVWSVSDAPAAAANGAIWIPSFAAGGVARSPMILVGERSDGIPEAVVPMTAGGRIPMGFGPDGPHAILPSGQRIPGSFVGYASGGILGNVGGSSTSGGLHVHNYFVSSEAEAQAHASSNAMSESDIVNIVSRDLMRGGATYRAVQRGGGR